MFILGEQDIVVLPVFSYLHLQIVVQILQFKALPSLLVEISLQRIKIGFETSVHLFQSINVFTICKLSVFVGGDESRQSFLAFEGIYFLQLLALIVKGIVKILYLSFEVVD